MSSSWPQNEYSRMFREIRNMPKYSLWIASCTENITFLRIYKNHKIAFKVLHIVNGSLFAFFLQRVHVRDLVSRSPIKCKRVVSPGTTRFTFTLKLPIYLSINSIYLNFFMVLKSPLMFCYHIYAGVSCNCGLLSPPNGLDHLVFDNFSSTSMKGAIDPNGEIVFGFHIFIPILNRYRKLKEK